MKQLLCLNCSRLNALGSARCANEDCRMALTPRTSRLVDDQPPSADPFATGQLRLCPNCNGLTLAPDALRCPECRWPTSPAAAPSAAPHAGSSSASDKAKRGNSSKSASKSNIGGGRA